MPSADFNGPVDFIRSPTKNLSSCHQMQHLFLQSVRSLLQFVPGYVKADQVKDIVCSMLEVRTSRVAICKMQVTRYCLLTDTYGPFASPVYRGCTI